ncbi:lipoprotein insertase outer membrane protein LolB [Paenalcaligenes hominis]|uniref:lipoprotein insertase outer membrane protein LolB n=1 Tax=Paenalcaligenes hominis TaxID=643674 RepID=UPI003525915E
MKHRIQQFAVAAILVGGVVGCSVTPHQDTRYTVQDQFQRSGRFALSVEKNTGERDAVQGGFVWNEQQQRIQLDLNNPMGSVLARVVADEQGAQLHYPNGDIEYAQSADALVAQLLGYELPVEGMKDWLHGQTGSRPVSDLKREQDQIVYFQQDNWRVRLQRYDELGPRLLQMNRTQPSQSFSVRIVVDY